MIAMTSAEEAVTSVDSPRIDNSSTAKITIVTNGSNGTSNGKSSHDISESDVISVSSGDISIGKSYGVVQKKDTEDNESDDEDYVVMDSSPAVTAVNESYSSSDSDSEYVDFIDNRKQAKSSNSRDGVDKETMDTDTSSSFTNGFSASSSEKNSTSSNNDTIAGKVAMIMTELVNKQVGSTILRKGAKSNDGVTAAVGDSQKNHEAYFNIINNLEQSILLFDQLFHDISPTKFYNDASNDQVDLHISRDRLTPVQNHSIKHLSGYLSLLWTLVNNYAMHNHIHADEIFPEKYTVDNIQTNVYNNYYNFSITSSTGASGAYSNSIANSNSIDTTTTSQESHSSSLGFYYEKKKKSIKEEQMYRTISILHGLLTKEVLRSEEFETHNMKLEDQIVKLIEEKEELERKCNKLLEKTKAVEKKKKETVVTTTIVQESSTRKASATKIQDAQSKILKSTNSNDFLYLFIRKKFGSSYYFGQIVDYNEPFFRVIYEDCDSEDLPINEVISLLWLANVPKSKREQCKGHAKLTYDITIPDLGNVNETSRIQNGINDSLRSGTSSTTSSSGNHEIKHLFIPKDTGPLIPSALFAHPCRVQSDNIVEASQKPDIEPTPDKSSDCQGGSDDSSYTSKGSKTDEILFLGKRKQDEASLVDRESIDSVH